MNFLAEQVVERPPSRILPIIIVAEFAGTSLWFAGNAILPDLQRAWNLGPDAIGLITSAVQLGFIIGTLVFAVFTLADLYSPRILFCLCSLCGALCNLAIGIVNNNFTIVLLLRMLTGFSLAGIYPIGMKIASGWYRQGLGNALGFLVGALVLGTSFPHLLKGIGQTIPWEILLLSVSIIAALGGMLMFLFVPDGPFLVKGTPFNGKALAIIFKSKDLRSAAFGYFGHMWELYTFYAFVPAVLTAYSIGHLHEGLNVSLWSFTIIAAGSLGCIVGGIISKQIGSARVAWLQLLSSGILCLLSPLLVYLPKGFFLGAFILWGIVVVGDSPQFSALVARHAPAELVGSALTFTNCIGFAITIISIQLTTYIAHLLQPEYLFSILTIGPLIGLIAFMPLLRTT
ncbi:MAG: MFS transporter [Ignavibacteria bacterium]|nr:MFS transporter [Ignavibacteria bacterium]MBI3766578.1 MFS transporter [Ignavibacteriales bacterium]